MVPTEKRSIDPVVSDTKPLKIEVGAALSPRVGEGQRICIEALCRSPLSPRGCATNISRRKESTSSTYLANQAHSLLGADDEMSENASRPSLTTTVADAKCSPTVRFFSVHLVVAAVADGSILSDQGTRKTKCVLDQLTRNVSKEQNQVVILPNENITIPLKLRVFVKASLEAKALNEYFARNSDQSPAPFVMLSRGLHMVVAYDMTVMDPSDAGVADRFRKQAKTRAVKLVKEAIETAGLDVSSALLRGHLGACRPAQILDPFLHARCVNLPMDSEICPGSALDSEEDRKCFVFEARQKKSSSPQLSSIPPNPTQDKIVSPLIKGFDPQQSSCVSQGKRSYEEFMQSSSYFPVTLYVTAVGEGGLAKDISEKSRERLESILSKIPKEQQTSIECGGGLVPLKLRVFVANSEDAKAVGDYVKDHSAVMPAAVVVLCKEIFITLRCEGGLDMKDSSVADRLRKQAKTRAVKLVRDLIVQAKELSLPILRGHNGPFAPSSILEPLLPGYMSGKGEGFWTDSTGKRFVVFSAKNKFNQSPAIAPVSPHHNPTTPPEGSFILEARAASPVLTHRLVDRHRTVTIDIGPEKQNSKDGSDGPKQQYTPSSLEGALLLDSCRILASHLAQEHLKPRSNETVPNTSPNRQSLVEGCWKGLEDESGKAKKLRVNPDC